MAIFGKGGGSIPFLDQVLASLQPYMGDPTYGGGPNPDGTLSLAGKAASAPTPRPGFLSGLPDRLALAQAYLSGDMGQVAAVQARQQEVQLQREALALRQQQAQQAQQDQDNQVWGLKSSGLFSNPQIAAMNPEGRSAAMVARVAPYTLSPGQERHVEGDIGQPERITRAPIAQEQTADWLGREDPTGNLRGLFAAHEAMPPISVQPGGGAVGAVRLPSGGYGAGYIVQPDGMSQPQGGGAGAAGGSAGAMNNPGGLRYPGSTRYRSFSSPQAGIAAQDAQLGRYFQRGLNTVRSIVETWAPRRSRGGDNSDSSVDNYISHVAGRLGVSPDQPLPPSMIPAIRNAQDEFETGRRGTSPRPGQASSPGQAAALRAEAQRAIAAGADPAAVNARLRAMGVN